MSETTTGKPMIAIRVTDLDRSVAFYRDGPGCTLSARDDDSGLAWIEHDGFSMLLADDTTADLSPYLDDASEIVRQGATIFLNGGRAEQIDVLRQLLTQRGLADVRLIERSWGDVFLTLPDPDGYTVTFWTTVDRTPSETLILYETGSVAVEQAVADLDDAELNHRLADNSWSIREIIHHLADAEIVTIGRLMYALAEPGRQYNGNPYSPDAWTTSLDYAGRAIAPALALFHASRGHASQLMRHIPDAWNHATINAEGEPITAGVMIGMLASHALEHIEEIREIRRRHEV